MSGLLAEFATEDALARACEHLRAAGVGAVESYTPAPPDETEGGSVLPLVILLAGVGGAVATFLLQTYATVVSYPMNIGGRPDFSWPAYVPMAFEMGVLCAVAAGVIGFLVAQRMPALYDSIDEAPGIQRASRDGFFVAVRQADAAALDRARETVRGLAPLHVEAFP